MLLLRPTILLFGLNLLDALLTIVWVRTGVATEGNQMMAHLLDIGNGPFLSAKLAVGVIASYVLVKFGDRPVARYGILVALAVYLGLMGVHLMTGLAAFGIVSNGFIHNITNFPSDLAATFNC